MALSRLLLRSTFSRGAWSSRLLPARPFRAPYSTVPTAPPGLSRENIQNRILDVLRGFEKVDTAKLNPSSSFSGDLGLDSLDTVEVVMAVEEEFQIIIPDVEADEIQTVDQAIDYIANTPNAQ